MEKHRRVARLAGPFFESYDVVAIARNHRRGTELGPKTFRQASYPKARPGCDLRTLRRVGAYCAITEQVKNLAEGQMGLRTETSRLD
jgi:hypothetical protein